ncbi:MAG TPA: hypothetical protein VI282_18705 [Verrucomicrobiae bacterium]
MAANGQLHKRDGGNHVSGGNSLKRVAVKLKIVRVKLQQVALRNHAEDPQHEYAKENFAVDVAARFAKRHALAKRKRHRNTDDEQEQRHDQIPSHEALPFDVFELTVKPVRQRIRKNLAHGHHERCAAHDPEHVETAKRINTNQALWRSRSASFELRRLFGQGHKGLLGSPYITILTGSPSPDLPGEKLF